MVTLRSQLEGDLDVLVVVLVVVLELRKRPLHRSEQVGKKLGVHQVCIVGVEPLAIDQKITFFEGNQVKKMILLDDWNAQKSHLKFNLQMPALEIVGVIQVIASHI